MRHIVILTGAGMSAESGIKTFRDSGGLWENYRIEDVATPKGFRKNPQLVLDFYNQRRIESFASKPNDGHLGLADMENEYKITIITQNVDNLHEQAGSTNVIHLHGELSKVRSSRNENLIYELSPLKPEIHLGDTCELGSQLRPHIVWFGEAVPMINTAADITATADIFVIIGTSMNVYPAAGLINNVPKAAPIYLIDPNAVNTSHQGIHYIHQGASDGVKELRQLLKSL